jgi:hypothetical protein
MPAGSFEEYGPDVKVPPPAAMLERICYPSAPDAPLELRDLLDLGSEFQKLYPSGP